MEEVAALMDACVGRDDREHLLRFIIIEIGIAGASRPCLNSLLTMSISSVGLSIRDSQVASTLASAERSYRSPRQ